MSGDMETCRQAWKTCRETWETSRQTCETSVDMSADMEDMSADMEDMSAEMGDMSVDRRQTSRDMSGDRSEEETMPQAGKQVQTCRAIVRSAWQSGGHAGWSCGRVRLLCGHVAGVLHQLTKDGNEEHVVVDPVRLTRSYLQGSSHNSRSEKGVVLCDVHCMFWRITASQKGFADSMKIPLVSTCRPCSLWSQTPLRNGEFRSLVRQGIFSQDVRT
jgi:hypothetical protein